MLLLCLQGGARSIVMSRLCQFVCLSVRSHNESQGQSSSLQEVMTGRKKPFMCPEGRVVISEGRLAQ